MGHLTSPRNQLATEILENLAKFPHCILLTRVGQFYEVSVPVPFLKTSLRDSFVCAVVL
jgi:hypothetical protein